MVLRSESDEYVEITNAGDAPQDLDGWTLSDREGAPVFVFPPWLLEPGGTVRVYTDEIHSEWGGFSFARGTPVWNNSEPDTAELLDDSGELVDSKSYPPGCE